MLKLYHFWSSTCSRKVRICLAEKKIEWESHHIDIVNKLDNLQNWYLTLNPNGVVPTLEHDGRVIIESNIIMEYLDDFFPKYPLKPKNAFEISRMRQWLLKSEAVVHRNVNVISWNKRHMPRMKHLSHPQHLEILNRHPNPEARKMRIDRLENGVSEADELFSEERLSAFMDGMEDTLRSRTWLAGEEFSLADISIAPFIERFEANDLKNLIDFKERPNVGTWWERIKSRYSYQDAYAFKNPGSK